jgi:hypothetical protein
MTESHIEIPSELLEALADIDDKLRERGMIVSLCKDECAESTLRFMLKKDEGIFLQVNVEASEAFDVNESVAERIGDFVASKIYDVFGGGSFSIEDDFMGVKVYVNDELAY